MTEENKAALDKCPFCSSDARLQTDKGRTGKVCISSYFRQYAHCKNKKCGLMTRIFKRPGQATQAWNNRAKIDDALEELQELVETLEKAIRGTSKWFDREFGQIGSRNDGMRQEVERSVIQPMRDIVSKHKKVQG
jgi:hypothetical protein